MLVVPFLVFALFLLLLLLLRLLVEAFLSGRTEERTAKIFGTIWRTALTPRRQRVAVPIRTVQSNSGSVPVAPLPAVA